MANPSNASTRKFVNSPETHSSRTSFSTESYSSSTPRSTYYSPSPTYSNARPTSRNASTLPHIPNSRSERSYYRHEPMILSTPATHSDAGSVFTSSTMDTSSMMSIERESWSVEASSSMFMPTRAESPHRQRNLQFTPSPPRTPPISSNSSIRRSLSAARCEAWSTSPVRTRASGDFRGTESRMQPTSPPTQAGSRTSCTRSPARPMRRIRLRDEASESESRFSESYSRHSMDMDEEDRNSFSHQGATIVPVAPRRLKPIRNTSFEHHGRKLVSAGTHSHR